MGSHTRKLIIMVGESGSGKTTIAKKMCADNPKMVRLERDELRIELANDPAAPPVTSRRFEEFVGKVQKARAEAYLKMDVSVIISDTNLSASTRAKWEEFARHRAEFDTYRVMTSLEDCIRNDSGRIGKARVGRAVIERQFLLSKRLPLDPSKEIIICDIDGTIADHRGIRSPYEEHKVLKDLPFQNIIDMVNEYHDSNHTVLIVSGRHSTCGPDTIKWLDNHGVKFDHIFMRHGWDRSHDYIVKQQILDEILGMVSKDLILRIFDDRPRVISQVWVKNNLPIQPVYNGEIIPLSEWTTEHKSTCSFVPVKGFGRCPECGAIEAF